MKRDLFKEYRQGLLSWDEAFCIANNLAATASADIELEDGFLLCQTQKVEGVRFVSVPVVWLLRIRLMNDSISNKVEK